MPEGVELLISCEKIKSIIKGKQIVNSVIAPNSRFAKHKIENYDPYTFQPIVEDVSVKGKLMYWKFSNGQYMLNTYGMTGQWTEQETKHKAFTLYYVDPNTAPEDLHYCKYLHFNDPRHFGTIKFVSKEELEKKLNSLGWDPLSIPDISQINIIKKKINKKKPIGELLMNQSIFCGVGNYIRAEALYRAKINPWKWGKELSEEELSNLMQHIIDVMQESYKLQGASFNSYQNVDQERGKYSNFFKVYGQKNDPNGYNIVRENMGSRTIHWCPQVQV